MPREGHEMRRTFLLLALGWVLAGAPGCGASVSSILDDHSVLGVRGPVNVLPDERELDQQGFTVISSEPGILRVAEDPSRTGKTPDYVIDLFHVAGANGRREVVASMTSELSGMLERDVARKYQISVDAKAHGWIDRLGMLHVAVHCRSEAASSCKVLPGRFVVYRPSGFGMQVATMHGVLHILDRERFIREFGPFEPIEGLLERWREIARDTSLMTEKDREQILSVAELTVRNNPLHVLRNVARYWKAPGR